MAKRTFVEGHRRSDGTWVKPHYREVAEDSAEERARDLRGNAGGGALDAYDAPTTVISAVKGWDRVQLDGEGDTDILNSDFSRVLGVVRVYSTPGENGGTYITEAKFDAGNLHVQDSTVEGLTANIQGGGLTARDSTLLGVVVDAPAEEKPRRVIFDGAYLDNHAHREGSGMFTRSTVKDSLTWGDTSTIDTIMNSSVIDARGRETYIKDSFLHEATIFASGSRVYMEKGIVREAGIRPAVDGAELKLNNACITSSDHFYGFARKVDGAPVHMYRGAEAGGGHFVVMQSGNYVLQVRPSTLQHPTTGDLQAMQKITGAANQKDAYDSVVRAINHKPKLMEEPTKAEEDLIEALTFQGLRK